MKFLKAVPILYSKNVSESLAYFIEKLKFENKWEWDPSASFGGVYRGEVEIFFCKDDQGHPGTWLSLMVDNVDEYFESIKDHGAKIISRPDSKEWNIREMLVECPDGHILRIGHNTLCD